jgi:hypothetical protein
VLLLLHLVFAGAWLGMHVVLGVLVCTLFVSDDPRVISVSYRALVLFAIWPLLSVALLCLLSGLALGMVTKYGVLRYRWVVVKLALNVVLAVLIAFALPGGLEAAALAGQRIAEGAAAGPAVPADRVDRRAAGRVRTVGVQAVGPVPVASGPRVAGRLVCGSMAGCEVGCVGGCWPLLRCSPWPPGRCPAVTRPASHPRRPRRRRTVWCPAR